MTISGPDSAAMDRHRRRPAGSEAAHPAPPVPHERIGLAGALVALAVIAAMPALQGLPPAGQVMLAILAFAVIVWMTEALDYAVPSSSWFATTCSGALREALPRDTRATEVRAAASSRSVRPRGRLSPVGTCCRPVPSEAAFA